MAQLTIGDQTITVDDSFLDLSPEEQQAAVEEISASLGIGGGSSPEPTLEERGASTTRQFGSGMNEGLANVIGGPVDLAQGGINLGIKGINALFGSEIDPLEGSVGGSDWLKGAGETDLPIIGPMIYPEAEGYETSRKVGEYTGTGVGTLLTMGGAGAGGVNTGVGLVDDITKATAKELAEAPAKTISKEAAASAAAVPGGAVGGDLAVTVADAVGAENPEDYRGTGEFVGELITGTGTAAGLEKASPGHVASDLFSDPESAARLAAAERQGVTPSAGLVGNQGAAYIENTAGLNPVASGSVTRKQAEQVEQVGDVVQNVTDDLRAPSGAAQADTPYSAGAQVRAAGDDAYSRLQTRLGMLAENEMDSLGGPKAALAVKQTREAIEEAMPRLTPAQQKEMRLRLKDLETMRVTGYETWGSKGQYEIPQGTPIDDALDVQIKSRLNRRIGDLDALEKIKKPTDAQKRQMRNLRHRIKVDIAQINNNLGVTNEQLNAWRRELGQELPNRGAVGSREQRETYAGIRDDQRIKAAQEGTLGEFAEATGEQKRLSGGTPLEEGGDAKFLKSLTQDAQGNPKEPQAVWNFLMQKDAAGRIEAYRRSVTPEEFSATMGNMIDMMAVPRSQGARAGTMNTEDFSPKKFLTQWKNLPKETQNALFDTSDVQQRVKDIETLSSALAARGTASNPSGTTATAIIAKIMGEGARNPALTLATLTANAGAARLFMSEPVARAIAKEYPTLYQEIVRELPQAGARATIEDEE